MVVDSVKATYPTEAVVMEEVAAVEEDVVAIRIAPTTPGTVLIYNIFMGISELPIEMIFMEMA